MTGKCLANVQNDIDSYMVEVHSKKYAIPVACMVFVLLGVPLGAMAKTLIRRRNWSRECLLASSCSTWIFLIGGEKLADRGENSRHLCGMWGGNILLAALGIFLTWRVTDRTVPAWDSNRSSNYFSFKKKTENSWCGFC